MLEHEVERLKASRPLGRPHDERGFNQVVASLGRATKKAVRAETPSLSNSEIDRERNARKRAQERFASRFAIYLELIREFARERGMATNFEKNDTAFLEAVAMLKTGRRDF
jgi:DNA-binding transcriptional regulator YiaG